jgi:hypothetical protein
MKYLTPIFFLAMCCASQAQKAVLAADNTLPIPKLNFDQNGELKITASPTSSQSDFDLLVRKWKMHNRRINKILEDSKEWTGFESSTENSKVLCGTADMDTYSTTKMPGQEGNPFEGLTLRLSNRKTRLWSLYWIASNVGGYGPGSRCRFI